MEDVERREIYNRSYFAANKDKILERRRIQRATIKDYLASQQKIYQELHKQEALLKKQRAYVNGHYSKSKDEDNEFFEDIPLDEGCILHPKCLTCLYPDCQIE